MADDIVMAVVEEQSDPRIGESIAADILSPAFAELRGETKAQWGVKAAQVRKALRNGPSC